MKVGNCYRFPNERNHMTSLDEIKVPSHCYRLPGRSQSVAQQKRSREYYLEAVQSLADIPCGTVHADQDLTCSPRAMITLLTYCYSTGVFGSRDIELQINRDRMVRYLCANTYPDWNVIRAFRRQYRDKIQHCLERVVGIVRELHWSVGCWQPQ